MSKPSSLQTIVTLLPTLKPKEQVEVRKRLDFLLQTTVAVTNTKMNEWFEECICEELIRRGCLHRAPNWKQIMPRGYRQEHDAVLEFLNKAVGRPLITAEKYALGKVVARALADYLINTPGFGLRVMLQQINKVPQALDASFPGYVASGMLWMLIKSRGK